MSCNHPEKPQLACDFRIYCRDLYELMHADAQGAIQKSDAVELAIQVNTRQANNAMQLAIQADRRTSARRAASEPYQADARVAIQRSGALECEIQSNKKRTASRGTARQRTAAAARVAATQIVDGWTEQQINGWYRLHIWPPTADVLC